MSDPIAAWDLDSHVALELVVVRQIDTAEPALAEQLADLVAANSLWHRFTAVGAVR